MSATGNTPLSRPSAGATPLIIACVLATWLIWGSTYLAIKWALVSFPPFVQAGTRFIVAGGALFAWSMLVQKAALPTGVQWRNALLIGALMLGGGMGGTATAEQTIGSGLIVAFIGINPMVTTAINRCFGVRPQRLEIIGTLVGFAGVLLLVQGAEFRSSPAGLVAQTAACICWALGSVLSQRLPLAAGAMGYASEMLCGGVVLLALSALTGETLHWPPTPLAVGAWFYLVAFGSLVAFNAYMFLLSRTSIAVATSYAFVNPIIALFLGVVLGRETVTGDEWFASAVVLAGVALLLWQRRTGGR